jgi:hypothetical protein
MDRHHWSRQLRPGQEAASVEKVCAMLHRDSSLGSVAQRRKTTRQRCAQQSALAQSGRGEENDDEIQSCAMYGKCIMYILFCTVTAVILADERCRRPSV